MIFNSSKMTSNHLWVWVWVWGKRERERERKKETGKYVVDHVSNYWAHLAHPTTLGSLGTIYPPCIL